MADATEPPVSCGHCGTEIKFEPGQLVGDPAAIDRVKRYQEVLHLWRQWWDDRLTDSELGAPISETDEVLR